MSRRKSRLALVTLLAMAALSPMTASGQRVMLWDKLDPSFVFGRGQHRVQSGAAPSKKSCADLYPIPEAAKGWTDCQAGQFSQCGGPEECTCNDPRDRLVWHECKQGSYARCEDDNTCEDSCRY